MTPVLTGRADPTDRCWRCDKFATLVKDPMGDRRESVKFFGVCKRCAKLRLELAKTYAAYRSVGRPYPVDARIEGDFYE